MPPAPEDELREALHRHGEATGRQWQAKIHRTPRPAEKHPVVWVELTCDDARALAALIRASTYLGTAAVARRIHVTQTTIRSWLVRNLPKDNPFPKPERFLGRNQWQQAAIDAWQARQAQTERPKRGKRPTRQ